MGGSEIPTPQQIDAMSHEQLKAAVTRLVRQRDWSATAATTTTTPSVENNATACGERETERQRDRF